MNTESRLWSWKLVAKAALFKLEKIVSTTEKESWNRNSYVISEDSLGIINVFKGSAETLTSQPINI